MIRGLTAFLMCFCMGFVSPATATASTKLLTVADVTARGGELSRQLVREMDRPEVQAKVAELGISVDEARSRIAALSDREIQEMTGQHGPVQAGGDIVIGVTTLLLIIIIILLIRR